LVGSLCIGSQTTRSNQSSSIYPSEPRREFLKKPGWPLPPGLTKAIQGAIDEVFLAGCGIMYVPVETFLTGGLELESRVALYLEPGSVQTSTPIWNE
jgi:hypothetical protein